MSGRSPTRESAQYRRARIRRQRRGLVLAIAVLVAIAVIGAIVGRPNHNAAATTRTTTSAARQAAQPVRLAPPGPIPGYLLIADRGNNRMLLVDGAKRIYWGYPAPDSPLSMPFRFDDDTFFGPKLDRIISNQEDQNTIQVISFPGQRVLWRYGHVDVKGHTPGYLNTPDDAYLLPNGLVTVADAYNCRVLFISHAHRIVKQYGSGVCR
ncbi:MAG TPA: hypothetical protein VNY33_09615, partial [Gaiellaceae bacterium]|nr:hypothetical protein [Gaiellaceae bacterium]